MADDRTFHCTVVTPERVVLECEARFVAFPAWDGEMGVLRRRAPLLVRLDAGVLKVDTAAGRQLLLIDGGFAEMVGERLTILTEDARRPETLDAGEAAQRLAAARALPAVDEAAFAARQRALRKARAAIKLAAD